MGASFNSTGHRLAVPDVLSSDGVYVFDGAGRRYLDLTAGVWCVSVGHRNPRVGEAIRAQFDALSHAGFGYSHPIVDEAAADVLSVCDMEGGGVVFLCSGSEAIDYARQVTRAITGNEISVAFHDTYVGSLSSALDRSNWAVVDWEKCPSCSGGLREEECQHLGELPKSLAEFLFEPGSSAGRVGFSPRQLVHTVIDRVRGAGGKVIANEVTTGFGRTGAWFGHDHYGIRPDLIALGKGIGNGYPVSAVVMSAETRQELEATNFRYMQSHQNDPLGAAAVKAVIAVIRDEGLIERAAANGVVFLEALIGLRSHDRVADVRGRGLMFAVDLRDEPTCAVAYQSLIDMGYIVCLRGATLRIDPPLTTSQKEFLGFVDALDEVLSRP